jgi:hypothetical protein
MLQQRLPHACLEQQRERAIPHKSRPSSPATNARPSSLSCRAWIKRCSSPCPPSRPPITQTIQSEFSQPLLFLFASIWTQLASLLDLTAGLAVSYSLLPATSITATTNQLSKPPPPPGSPHRRTNQQCGWPHARSSQHAHCQHSRAPLRPPKAYNPTTAS